jgi:protein SCO1/2
MSQKNNLKKYIGLAGILFLFPLVWLLFFGVFGKHNFKTLPHYGPEALKGADSSIYMIPDFAFSDENGQIFTRDSLIGKVWLATFYNLNSPNLYGITERLLSVNFKYAGEPDIVIVNFSTDCSADTQPARLEYVQQNTRYNEFPGKWKMLSGNQDAMQSYIRNGFLISDISNEAIFRLIDADGHIRGLYGNTEYHFLGGGGDSIPGVVQDIALLKKEIDLRNYHERKAREKTKDRNEN